MNSFLKMAVAALALLNVQARRVNDSFTISGVINGVSSGKAVLVYREGNIFRKKISVVKAGSFHFTGLLPEVQQVTINISGDNFNESILLFAGNEKIAVKADTTSFTGVVIEGSASQKEYDEYYLKVAPIEKKSNELNETGSRLFNSGSITETIKDSLFKIHDNLDAEKKAVIAAFAKEHPASAVSAWAIASFFGFDPQPYELEPAYNSLSVTNQKSFYGKQIKEIIRSVNKTAIGKMAPAFTQNDVKGKLVSLFTFRGKYILLDFWASWCGPCRAENPNLTRLYKEYHSANFDILGVSMDTDKEKWLKAIADDRLIWTELSNLSGLKGEVATKYGLKGLPFNLLIDPTGKIIAKNLKGKELANKLKEIL